MAERRSVAADVVGSKPTSRPKNPPKHPRSPRVERLTLPRVPKPAVPETPAAAPPGLFVGTSGWAYPTWKPGFYPAGLPQKSFLPYFSSQLNSVEVNYTFRTLPSIATLENWLADTPPGFRFSFKAPQRITHFSRLRDTDAAVTQFLASLEPVRQAGKLGLVLFQLPPNFQADPDRLQAFLHTAALHTPTAPPISFEFRHPTWFADRIADLLHHHGAAYCIAESDDLRTPELHTAPHHTAFRLRRSGGYTEPELQTLAHKFSKLRQTHPHREIYIYLKHEDQPTGPKNAVTLLHRLNHLAS